ncbi:phage tail protein [Pectobacterium parmentieri]|uniref:phage tail protein n=1 Tax=Pectobacterium parmentieri TaxID=1905730 RepID=UPI00051A644F|nr:phage tail protein [Pectobacterium parmentieri]AOR59441.1 phage tail protein [Pectobacterium parmentieri]AYH09584.1 phage tail protein [Pectobacterium parmentieri]AYH19707.1 phage tail protein [Pectobacterium parmentieri]AYH35896.1 phage tail protein [Pectobacterium parmentieri]AZS55965.1 phage tail protein [Pectobacterium parmentieri]
MANLSEQESWIDGIYQLETSDPVVAGPGGISNRQAEQLASRTAYLKKMQETTGDNLQKHLAASDPHSQYAPKNSPALTGTPTAPTTAQTANNTQIATTAFVKSAIAALVNGSPAALDTLQELAKALGNDPSFSTTVLSAIAEVKTDATNRLNAHASILDAHPQYAPKASPAFTGKPTAPTAAPGANDTQLATTAFVKAAVTALVNGSPAALDTLQELANALGNDPNFSTTVLNALAGKLAKDQNGADIPDKASFLSSLKYRGRLANGETFAACNKNGIYLVAISDGLSVTDMPTNIRGDILYSYGFLFVEEISGVISQTYLPHRGPIATRQNWDGVSYSLGWNVMLDGIDNKPTATDIGALPITGGVLSGGIRLKGGNLDLPINDAVVGVLPGDSYRQMLSLASDDTVVVGNPISSMVINTKDNLYIRTDWGPWHPAYHAGNLTPTTIGAMSISELAGIPLPFPGAVAPAGWLKCNGQAFDKSLYPILASLYPSGVLPDLRGEFVRGWDDGRGADAGRALLSAQGDAIRNIVGTIGQLNDRVNTTETAGVFDANKYTGAHAGLAGGNGGRIVTFDASKIVPTANENRPRNIAFNYIVRAA